MYANLFQNSPKQKTKQIIQLEKIIVWYYREP